MIRSRAKRARIRWLGLMAVAIALILFACNYGHKPFRPEITGDLAGSLFTVEIDDYGSFWSAAEADAVLHTIGEVSDNTNTIVLLYVHGWHHSARRDEGGNLEKFEETLARLNEKLAKELYTASRETLTGSSDVRLVGIYIGWRGRSLPGFLDYATVWGRKSAAERVGAGDLGEFISRLQKLYERRNVRCKGRSPQECQSTFMGLVLVGHSLGGQVLLKSVSPALESAMISATEWSSWSETTAMASLSSPLSAVGDMTVLINPALEAYQFERLHRLNAQLAYNHLQTPLLFVVSGEGDAARQIAFPLARMASRPFRPGFREFQKPLWHTALGEYEPQRTHRLERTTASDSLSDESYHPDTAATVVRFDFTAEVNFGGGKLKPLGSRYKRYSPIVVAYSSEKLIEGHSGIFTETFRDFLIDYVAFVEGKRMLTNRLPAVERDATTPAGR